MESCFFIRSFLRIAGMVLALAAVAATGSPENFAGQDGFGVPADQP